MISAITAGTAFSQVLSPTLVDVDDGTYTYKWSLSAGVTTLALSSTAAANPTLSATSPVAGTAYLDLKVTDSAGNAVSMTEQSIVVGVAEVAQPPLMATHYQALTAPPVAKKKGKKK